MTALYFSFVTATSVGYGDVVPMGVIRIVAIAEAITGLLIFGSFVFLSIGLYMMKNGAKRES